MARILVIEDNRPNMELTLYLLDTFGHETVAAYDGAAGLDAIRAGSFALVLCDVQIPQIDGFELVRRIRSDPAHAHLKVIAVTALAMASDRDRVLAAGFDGYVAKPIDPETFVAEVESYLPSAEPLRSH